ncbi:DUF2934 domain-containing protein [Pseudogemmobacter blasticus]|uniref:DUF2934 domain-containing protein n=1 Tax=Fuscovulum blasticum DSM 2131 TaxID=1188250 RepID=A0A2T4J8R8_FUSBL|nr:DUF2934 domain-containing protein [Fuscovulum blasticum]PTE14295.1 DUF2934 domain-containing protein [Fuscovulum blasticum DSM 2131]
MSEVNETVIRARAYAIWLREGCPEDAADRHWYQAVHELMAETGVDPVADPAPEPPAKPKARARKPAVEKAEAPREAPPKAPARPRAPRTRKAPTPES